jgi:glycosyltransferase involved in cell wall biosynthesis
LLSPSFGAPFAALAGLPASGKLVCIPNPLTFDDEPDMAMLNKEKKLIYIGRFDRTQKRVDRVVTIFKALRARYPDWELQLVGDGEQRAELEQMSEGIAAITFAGTIADPRDYLKRASILLLTSEFEGFGMVLTEALQFGVVPVAYDSYTALRDIVSDGRNGFAVAPFDQQRFIGRLDELMGNPDQLAAMGVAAMHSASRFKKTAVLPQWLPVLAGTANLESAI